MPSALERGRAEAGDREITNGRYRSLLTRWGTGGSWLDECSLTRWRDDRVADVDGFFLFLREVPGGPAWPLVGRFGPRDRGVICEDDAQTRTFAASWSGISWTVQAWVDPSRPVEWRRVTIRNRERRERTLQLTSWVEVTLDDALAFEAHPAFSRLFVQTEPAIGGVVVAHRRPREKGRTYPWLAHVLDTIGTLERETDRARFLGRGRSLRNARALAGGELSDTLGNVLDPILALRRTFVVGPGEERVVGLGLAAAERRNEAVAAVRSRGWGPPQAPSDRVESSTTPGVALPETHGPEHERGKAPAPAPRRAAPMPAPDPPELESFNGWGGFDRDAREYVIRFERDETGALRLPPAPWVNVIASPAFGCVATETGAGCTWSRNSRLNRLSPWSNDPVTDPHDEALYLRDEERAVIWSPTPGPAPSSARFETRHGFGYTRYRCEHEGLIARTTVLVAARDPVKIVRVAVENPGAASRRLSFVASRRLARAADGTSRRGAFDAGVEALIAPGGDGLAVFSAAVVHGRAVAIGHLLDRERFLPNGDPACPAAVERPDAWEAAPGPADDPGFATRVELEIPPGATRECAFVLGEAPDAEIAPLLERLRAPGALDEREREVRGFWEDLLGRVHVETPAPALDLVLNGWLAYQTLACRLWARTAFFQSGGAFGFRDQLQDALGLIAYDPTIARRQIVLHAEHQFVEGDVLHWWHPAGADDGRTPPARPGAGIRTRFVDDLLWLPWLAATYVQRTGDDAVLAEPARFVAARPLEAGEDEAFVEPEWADEVADVYEHAARAIDRSLATGAHGLPLFGTGDWNDGMNRVGREGRGESVWMAFFLHTVIDAFAPHADRRGDAGRGARWRGHQQALRTAIEEHAWDGEWYRRGYHDDGAPLGSRENDECRIDALAQAWAVLSGAARPERAAQAMDAVERELISDADGIVRLLAPPFDHSPHDPGYIQGYVPGVRENGGQYTHAALWVVQALAKLGRHERAARVLEMLSPVSHTRDASAVERYGGEPYVVAADVYGAPPHVGRAGWTWYTGSSGWMIRVALESVLGVTIDGGRTLVIAPAIPASWPGYRVTLRPHDVDAEYRIEVEQRANPRGTLVEAFLDGAPLAPESENRVEIPLRSDGQIHVVRVVRG